MTERSTPSVRRYVATVAAVALVAAVGAAWFFRDGPHNPLLATVFALSLVVVNFLPVPIPRGRELLLFRFDEAVIIPMLLALGVTDAIGAMAVGTSVAFLIARTDRIKFVFNTSTLVLGAAVASVVVTLVAGEQAPGPTPVGVAAAVLAVFLQFALNETLMAGVVARAGGASSTVALLRDNISTLAMMSTCNVAVGLLLVLPVFQAPWLLAGTLLPLLVLHSAYRAFIERSHEDEHLSNIRSYAQELLESLRVEDAAMGLVRSARELVGADRVELRITGHHFAYVSGHREEGPVDASTLPLMPARRATELVLQMRGRSNLDATLTVRSERSGVGEKAFSDRERMLLDMLTRQAQIGLDNALLFQRVTAEKTTLAQIFEHSTEGLLVVSQNGTVISWNPAMSRITGFAEQQLVGSPVVLLSPDLGPIAEAVESGSIETTITTARGQRRDIAAYYAPIPPSEGERDTRCVVVVNDVTSRNEAERLKNDFVATVSHELRTPLTAIKGFVDTMRRDDIVVSPSRFPLFLEIMGEQTERLDRLISDLLDVSAIESGRPLKLEPEVVALQPLLGRTVELFRSAAPGACVEVACEPTLTLFADPHRLQQVLTNLFDNACKHAGRTEVIDVEVKPFEGRVRISVTDRGPGIAEEDIEQIFDRFYFTSDSVTRFGGGAGLGLFICRQLVEAMGGAITCASRQGVGATFTVDLPQAGSLPDDGVMLLDDELPIVTSNAEDDDTADVPGA